MADLVSTFKREENISINQKIQKVKIRKTKEKAVFKIFYTNKVIQKDIEMKNVIFFLLFQFSRSNTFKKICTYTHTNTWYKAESYIKASMTARLTDIRPTHYQRNNFSLLSFLHAK